jgi:hypothetical protein
MSNTNYVNYQVALLPENAALINQLNELLITGSATNPKSAKTDKESSPQTSKPAAQKSIAEDPTPVANGTTLDQVKVAAKAAKKDHGEDFAMSVLDANGVKEAVSLGRRMGAIEESAYDTIIAAWQAGPQASDDLDDDDLDDDLDDDGLGDETANVSPEAVQTALKAYSKDTGRAEAKAIMTKHGAKALSDVLNCTPKQLAAMMADLV